MDENDTCSLCGHVDAATPGAPDCVWKGLIRAALMIASILLWHFKKMKSRDSYHINTSWFIHI